MPVVVPAGHAIMGLSNLQWPSLVATCCFMAGGFIMANLILPFKIIKIINMSKDKIDDISMSEKPYATNKTDFEVRSENAMCVNQSELDKPLVSNIKYIFAGIIIRNHFS